MFRLRALGVAGAFVVVLGACGSDGAADPGNGGVDAGAAADSGPPDPSAGCGAPGVTPGISSQSLAVGGAMRTYQLFVPDTYDNQRSLPLVFVFHGDGGTGANIRGSFKLEAETAGGAILVYPDGENKTWQIDTAAGLAKDVGFIDALAAELAKTHCTDQKRVFAVGFSKGAYFANQLACLAKTPLRAVVAHSGGGPFGVDGSGTKFDGKGNLVCPAAPLPAMQIIGGADGLLTEAQKARDYWERVNACKTTASPTDPIPCVAYDACAAERPEIYCEIPGLGHQIWTAAPKAIWSFLKSR